MRVILVALCFVWGCASTQTTQTANQVPPVERAKSDMNRHRLNFELATVDAEISILEAQIIGAKARLDHYKAMQTTSVNALIFNVDSELSIYEFQKSILHVRRDQLSHELLAL